MKTYKNSLLTVLFICALMPVSAQINKNIVELLNAKNPESFKELDLSNKKLGKLPAEIGRFINIEKLFLSNNNLQSLPIEISQLTKLKELYLE